MRQLDRTYLLAVVFDTLGEMEHCSVVDSGFSDGSEGTKQHNSVDLSGRGAHGAGGCKTLYVTVLGWNTLIQPPIQDLFQLAWEITWRRYARRGPVAISD